MVYASDVVIYRIYAYKTYFTAVELFLGFIGFNYICVSSKEGTSALLVPPR
jgi:hypothetical protein